MGGPLDTLIHGVRFLYVGATALFERKSIIFDPDSFTVTDDPDVVAGDPNQPTSGATRVSLSSASVGGTEGNTLILTETPDADLDVTGIGTIISAGSASTAISGLVAPATGRSQRIAMINDNDDSANFTLVVNSAVTEANNITDPTSEDHLVQSVTWVIYDQETQEWRIDVANLNLDITGDVTGTLDDATVKAFNFNKITTDSTTGEAVHAGAPVHQESFSRFRDASDASHGTPGVGEARSYWGKLQTTNATAASVLTFSLKNETPAAYGDGIVTISVAVTCASSAGGGKMTREITCRRHSGTMSIVHEEDTTISAGLTIVTAIAAHVDDNDTLSIHATGIASTDINWFANALVTWVKEAT